MRTLIRCAITIVLTGMSLRANAISPYTGSPYAISPDNKMTVVSVGANGISPSSADHLRHDLDSLFSDTAFSNATFGVAIQSLKTGEYLYRKNDTKSLMPASNMKLFTTAEALALLGPDWKYKTEYLTNGRIDTFRKIFQGDVIIRGVGDPSLMSATDSGDWAISDALERFNINKIRGSILIDNSYFTPEYYPNSWQVDDLPYYYATPVSAVEFLENKIEITIRTPDSVGQPASIFWSDIHPQYYVIENHSTIGTESSPNTFDIARKLGTDTLIATGNIPKLKDWDEVYQATSIQNPDKDCEASYERLLSVDGIKLLHSRTTQRQHQTSFVFAIDSSAPMSQLIDYMNKYSDNLYAECLFRTVGKVIGGEGSWTRGIAVMRKYLATIGIDTARIQFTDGSGLSRMDLVTADDIVTVLRAMASNPKLDSAFYNSLPIMGVDGTLQNQMKGTPAQGNIHAKTGSMTGVRAISGYLTTRDGEPIAFSIVANNYTVPGIEIGKLEDAVLLKLVNFSRNR